MSGRGRDGGTERRRDGEGEGDVVFLKVRKRGESICNIYNLGQKRGEKQTFGENILV